MSNWYPGIGIGRYNAKQEVLQNAAVADGNGTVMDVEGYASAVVEVSGTFSATVHFEISVDGSRYYPVLAQNLSTGTYANSTSSAGVWTVLLNGVKYLRARVSNYTSGSVTVLARAATTPVQFNSATISLSAEVTDFRAKGSPDDGASWVPFRTDAQGRPEVQLSGSNAPTKLAAGGVGSTVYTKTGSIAAGTTETVVNIVGREVHLESLTVGADYHSISLFIEPYNESGAIGGFLGVAAPAGYIYSPTPAALQSHSNGENDFFKVMVYNETEKKYVVAMKRQARFGNGVRIRLQNQDAANPHTIALNTMIYQMAPLSSS